MTEKSPPRTDRVSGPQCPGAATVTTADEVKDSTIFEIKNFTSAVETIEKKELVEDKKRKAHYQNSLLGIIVCFNQ